MKYFDLFDDMTTSDRWHLGPVTMPNGDRPRLTAGIHLDPGGKLQTRAHHEGPVLEFSLTSYGVPIVTPALARAVMGIAGQDVQCLPVEIRGHPDMVVLNVVRVVRCLDESQSTFTKWTAQDHRADLAGEYRSVPKLVIDPSAVPDDAHFFRVRAWEVALIVSDVARGVMERAGCRGATFTEVSPTG